MAVKRPSTRGGASAGPASYTKEQLLASQRYAKRRDLLQVLLEDGEWYTHAAVDKMTTDFLKGV